MKKTLLAVLAAATLAVPALVGAQDFSSRPVRLIVTYPPGGGADLMARLLAPKMGEALGTTVIVENKSGASGQIGAMEVLHAAPDGHTLLFDASSFAVNPSLYASLPYDPMKQFVPITVVALFPNMLVVNPSFPAKSVKDVIAMAKEKPGALAFASSGNGSAQHLAGELFRQKAGVDMTHVPYKGGGPALNDVMGGQIPMYFANMASGLPHVKAGKLRALAVTGSKRSPALPDVPTMAESGLAGYEVYEWNAIFAPAGTPAPVIARISEAVQKAMQAPQFKERLALLGGEPAGYTPDAAARFVHDQAALWGKVVREAHITPQ
jgi:tripartite-type tricarboxylate transporter receptor subunit TctC